MNFIRQRTPSLTMVVLVLLGIMLLQEEITYSTTFGRLEHLIRGPEADTGILAVGWSVVRTLSVVAVAGLWILNRKAPLFKAIVGVNGLLTVGLLLNVIVLTEFVFRLTPRAVEMLLVDVLLLAVSNILIFSIWYWIIDPPGVEEIPRHEDPWDFLFPQRGGELPNYETWQPKYTDYLYLAFTSSFAFSPTDTLPLTRRAKVLMMVQSVISVVTLTGIVGGAIGMLAGSGV